MALPLRPNNPRIDEHDVQFSDTRLFAFDRWNDAVREALDGLSKADRSKVSEPRDWQILADSIQEKAREPRNAIRTKSFLTYLTLLPSTLKPLVYHFVEYTPDLQLDFSVLWGIIELHTHLSRASAEKSTRALKWTKKLRGTLEVFNRCLETCEEGDINEARIKIVDVLEAILHIFSESIAHLRSCASDTIATREWPSIEKQISESLWEIETAGKHLGEITNFSKVNQARVVRELEKRHIPVPQSEEHVPFPLKWMNNRGRNEEFYGRTSELKKINEALDHTDNKSLQTYTIYGRRGVGKTDIALEYAYTNPSNFDAIFWIKCETAISIRQSYNDVAIELGLPGADRHGHHEENQIAVLRWLKTTSKRWLLIFDNAEREEILQGYWPLGAKGSILITSRTYENFLKDSRRKGDTVKPFDENDSWKLLMRLLGPKWVEDDKNGLITASEETTGRRLLKELGGLALAIQQVAEIIRNPDIGGDGTIQKTYRAFLEEKANLPDRPVMARSEIVTSLDSLWSLTFKNLTRSARSLLSVISLLSPDGILIDLFLPKNQSALDGRLAFCKQIQDEKHPGNEARLASVINVPDKLAAAIELLIQYKLITQEGREIFAHRVVQEAMNFHTVKDQQDCLHSAAALVYEAFPRQVNGDYLASQWGRCQEYISHGAHLSRLFAHLKLKNPSLQGTRQLVALLCNCARYLYEISDYNVCVRVCETARLALDDKNSLLHADICGAAGSAYYELNRLDDCRREWEEYLRLQEELAEDELERSASYNNMGNLEYAAENNTEAMRQLTRAVEIRQRAGDDAAGLLALSYLCLSRVHYANKDYKTAFHVVGKSESLFVRTIGASAHFMAYVHYAYGNIYFMQEDWTQAKASYDRGLKIALATAAIHPITIALHYSLGCVEFARDRNQYSENAKLCLDKALTIAQLRSPQRDDGTVARILWKTSVVLQSHLTAEFQEEAETLLLRAEKAKSLLNSSGEGKTFTGEDDDYVVLDNEENSFDALVPGFFR